MSQQKGKQPEIRFSKYGPNSIEGIAYVPKIFYFKKESISGTSNDDFFVAPAGTFIQQAFVRIDTELDGTPTLELGVDGNPDALIDQTDMDATTAGNWATNIGSTTAVGANGLYLHAGDTIRLAIGGSPTQGAISGFIQYVEMEAMESRGEHFDLS